MYKLIIQDDEGKTTVVPLIRDEVSIGRREGNTIRLTERNVSRRHARILRSNGSVQIEDLDSYNGIRVNGARIQGRVPVAESDRIQIGDYLLELKLDRAAQANDSFGSTEPFLNIPTKPIPRAEIPVAATLDDAATAPIQVPVAVLPAVEKEDRTPPAGVDLSSAAPVLASRGSGKLSAIVAAPLGGAATSVPAPSVPVAPMAQPHEDLPGRLVILSANAPGRELELVKSTMVIGRTEDNDLIIDHRSISRHHAKIIEEKGRFSIVDLGSSNGIRVNGEDYGKVDLRRGDIIELGHVRLRFVEPGETFVFDGDTGVYRPAAKARGRRWLPVAVGAVAVTTAVAALWWARNRPAEVVAVSAPSDRRVASMTEIMQTQKLPRTADQEADKLAVHLELAKKAIDEERWDDALEKIGGVFSLDGDNAEAKKLRDVAKRENAAQPIYQEFSAAAAKADFDTMQRQFNRLSDDSVYRAKAANEIEAVRERVGGDLVRDAERAAKDRRCDRLQAIGRDVETKAPSRRGDLDRLRIEAGCKGASKVVAEAQSARPVATVGRTLAVGMPAGRALPPPAVPAPAGGAATYDTLIGEARTAYFAKDFKRALTKADDALVAKPGDQMAHKFGTMAACSMRNPDVARYHFKKVNDAPTRNSLKAHCVDNGVSLEP